MYYNIIEKERREREKKKVEMSGSLIISFFFLVRKIKLNKLECMCIGRVLK